MATQIRMFHPVLQDVISKMNESVRANVSEYVMRNVTKSSGQLEAGILPVYKDGTRVAPVCYPDMYLDMIEAGKMTIEEAADKIINDIEKSERVVIPPITAEYVLKNVYFRMYDLNECRMYLSDKPFRRMENLAAISNLKDTFIISDILSILQNGKYSKSFGINDFVPGAEAEELYVIQSYHNDYGASVLMFPEVIDQVAQKMGKDVLLIPSSNHEILITEKSATTPEYIKAIVSEINATLDKNDFLTNEVYEYNRQDKELSCLIDKERDIEM